MASLDLIGSSERFRALLDDIEMVASRLSRPDPERNWNGQGSGFTSDSRSRRPAQEPLCRAQLRGDSEYFAGERTLWL